MGHRKIIHIIKSWLALIILMMIHIFPFPMHTHTLHFMPPSPYTHPTC